MMPYAAVSARPGSSYVPVRVPDYPDVPLTLVVSRPGKGRKPWYLITNEPIQTVEDAWRIVLAYNRRWQVEISIRYTKSELAFESPRLLKLGAPRKTAGDCRLGSGFPVFSVGR